MGKPKRILLYILWGFLISISVYLTVLIVDTAWEHRGERYEPTRFELSVESLEPRQAGAWTVWDVEIKLTDVTPRDYDRNSWNGCRLTVIAMNGTTLYDHVPLQRDDGNRNGSLRFLWIGHSQYDTLYMVGDSIFIVGMDTSFREARVILNYYGDIGSIQLPSDFPTG